MEDAKDRGFAIGASAPFAFDAPGAEVRFVDLDLSLNRRGLLTERGDPFPDQLHIAVDGVSVQTRQRRNFMSVQIEGKYLINSRNLASEILERFTYLLTVDMTSFLLLFSRLS